MRLKIKWIGTITNEVDCTPFAILLHKSPALKQLAIVFHPASKRGCWQNTRKLLEIQFIEVRSHFTGQQLFKTRSQSARNINKN